MNCISIRSYYFNIRPHQGTNEYFPFLWFKVSPSFGGTGIFSLGSRFKYSGHTEKEALQQVQSTQRQPPEVLITKTLHVIPSYQIFITQWVILGQIYQHLICYSLPGDLANDIHAENVIRPAKRMMNQKLKVGIKTI